ncbi:MAG TPA: hypothetical protein VN893_25340 [Bryobacteraceae bacterium]|nr:hypothetical protein [Bryobacteraceae bacterium]
MSDAERPLPDSPPSEPQGKRVGKLPTADNPPNEPASRQRKGTAPPRHEPKQDPAKALSRDALEVARKLRRKHRAYYDADTKGFRALVKKAHSQVFRLKPGPKPNARIAQAACERGRGVRMEDLYLRYIDHYECMTEHTRSLAEEGLRRKVNHYLQRHPAIRRRGQKDTLGDGDTKRLPPVSARR